MPAGCTLGSGTGITPWNGCAGRSGAAWCGAAWRAGPSKERATALMATSKARAAAGLRLLAAGGAAGTGFWVDPKEQLVAVFMLQSSGILRAYHRTLFRQLVYQAIVD